MTNFINTKIILSAAVILAAAGLIVGATFAFFSDTETSTGNVFAAGELDLKIDNTSYAIDHNIPGFQNPTGALVANTQATWTLKDLTIEKFFNFSDVKPGDYGEDTISVHVNTNNAWVCAAARVTSDLDNGFSEPEDEVFGTNNDLDDGTLDGDLDSGINFAFWKDDGDNVLELGEETSIFAAGPISNLNPQGKIALADAQGTNPFGNTPILGNSTVYIGKGWCFGTMVATPLAQDNLTTDGPILPDRVGTGFTCDGSAVGNIAQTDSVQGDLQFFAVQSRNNPTFSCETGYTPVWPSVTPTITPIPTL